MQLKIVQAGNSEKLIGVINWFPVHPTSMSNANHLVSSDNVGYASILLETSIDKENLPGQVSIHSVFYNLWQLLTTFITYDNKNNIDKVY